METTTKRIIRKGFDVARVTFEEKTVVTTSASTITNKLPLLPFKTWIRATSFLSAVAKKKNSEAIVSLTVVRGRWRIYCWHQETSGTLHVKYDSSSEENMAMLSDEEKLAFEKVHCTIHSHNKAGASQSSDDMKDEEGRDGWHIKVGNCDKPVMSSHCRFNVRRVAKFNEAGKKVAASYQDFIYCDIDVAVAPPKTPKSIHPKMLKGQETILLINYDAEFPEEWMDRVKKQVYSAPTRGNGQYGYQYGHQKKTHYTDHSSPQGVSSKQKRLDLGDSKAEQKAPKLTTKSPFKTPIMPLEPEWVLIQSIFNHYHRDSLSRAVDAYYGTSSHVLIDMKRIVDKVKAYFIVTQGCDPDKVEIALPELGDLMDVLVDTHARVAITTTNDVYTRVYEMELCQALYTEFKEGMIFTSIT